MNPKYIVGTIVILIFIFIVYIPYILLFKLFGSAVAYLFEFMFTVFYRFQAFRANSYGLNFY